MAKFYTELDATLREFIGRQQMFFHATAPNEGRINLSPKGLDTFRVLSTTSAWRISISRGANVKPRPTWRRMAG